MSDIAIGYIGLVFLFIMLFSGMPLGLAFMLVGFLGYGLCS
jgi:hypothetical protein